MRNIQNFLYVLRSIVQRLRPQFTSIQLKQRINAKVSLILKTRWKKFHEVVANDPILRNDPTDFSKSRSELIEIYARKTSRLHKVIGYDEETADFCVQAFPESMVATLSVKMFVPSIRNLGNEKQVEKWVGPAMNFQIVGCYAQTELGHGSDVQNLETTATYNQETDEFILNSPTVTATKWWIGDLGVFATHCVTQAQLIINGKNFGVQTFIVHLRDVETYKTLPGIQVGDIGPKFGYNTKDNGYLRFNQVKIPRENMLMKYAKVNKNGEFQKSMNDKIGYATMMEVRTSILKGSYAMLSMGLSIAVRYSLFRQQFKNSEGEEQIIFDYQTQQDKIVPLIADCYGMVFGSHRVSNLAKENITRINEKMDFSLMQDLHALLSCCKAVYTWQAYFGLEKLRQSLGGHGYSAYSRLPSLITEYAPNCTYEGENTVLLLQCARYLLKALQKAQKGQSVNENVEYLVNIDKTLQQKVKIERSSQLLCPETLRKILRINAAFHVQQAGLKMMTSIQDKDVSFKTAWDKHAGIALTEASQAHNHYYTMKTFMDSILKTSDENLKSVLSNLCCLYGINRVLERPNAYVEGGSLQGDYLEFFYEAKEQLLEALKPDVRALTDAFLNHDNSLSSALIQTNPYETMLDWSKNKNPVNDPKFQKLIYSKIKIAEGQKLKPRL